MNDDILPFPYLGVEGPRRGRNADVSVPQAVIEELGIEETAVYLRLAMWRQRGEAYDLERVADEVWFGSRNSATRWINELRRKGLLSLEADWHAERRAEREGLKREVAEEAARQAARTPMWGSGTWHGSWPLTSKVVVPVKGIPVVYYHYDRVDEVAYVGSTDNFPSRMNNHLPHRRSMTWSTWRARDCVDRWSAYRLEEREIARLRPPQNFLTRADYADVTQKARRS